MKIPNVNTEPTVQVKKKRGRPPKKNLSTVNLEPIAEASKRETANRDRHITRNVTKINNELDLQATKSKTTKSSTNSTAKGDDKFVLQVTEGKPAKRSRPPTNSMAKDYHESVLLAIKNKSGKRGRPPINRKAKGNDEPVLQSTRVKRGRPPIDRKAKVNDEPVLQSNKGKRGRPAIKRTIKGNDEFAPKVTQSIAINESSKPTMNNKEITVESSLTEAPTKRLKLTAINTKRSTNANKKSNVKTNTRDFVNILKEEDRMDWFGDLPTIDDSAPAINIGKTVYIYDPPHPIGENCRYLSKGEILAMGQFERAIHISEVPEEIWPTIESGHVGVSEIINYKIGDEAKDEWIKPPIVLAAPCNLIEEIEKHSRHPHPTFSREKFRVIGDDQERDVIFGHFVNNKFVTLGHLFKRYMTKAMNLDAYQAAEITCRAFEMHHLKPKRVKGTLIASVGIWPKSSRLPFLSIGLTRSKVTKSYLEFLANPIYSLVQALNTIGGALFNHWYPNVYEKYAMLQVPPEIQWHSSPWKVFHFNLKKRDPNSKQAAQDNQESKERSGSVNVHRDINDVKFGMCGCWVLGRFKGGEIQFPDLGLVLRAEPSDFVLFNAYQLFHETLQLRDEISGVPADRNSIVAYSDESTYPENYVPLDKRQYVPVAPYVDDSDREENCNNDSETSLDDD
ncbi:hypothetical protein G9A89_010219 [Geosiphon pyriformis]|nr:hypothetical protein G9A89_010219 [Geosiphon pyriformis]